MNFASSGPEFAVLTKENERKYKSQLYRHTVGVSLATFTSATSGVLFSLHSYSVLFKIDREDRIGKTEGTYSTGELLEKLLIAKFSEVFSCSSVKLMFFRHFPGFVANIITNKEEGVLAYLISQFISTLVTLPLEVLMHRRLLQKDVVGEWDKNSFFKGMMYRFVGKLIEDVVKAGLRRIMKYVFSKTMKLKKKIIGRHERLDRFIKNVFHVLIVRFTVSVAVNYATDKFNSKSLGIQLGRLDAERNFLDFSDLPERKNILRPRLIRTSMGLFTECLETYIFYGSLKICEACALLYKDKYFYTAHQFLSFLKDKTDVDINDDEL